MNYLAFMAAIPHTHFGYLEETLKEYNIGNYIIANEITTTSHKETNGQHFHFLVQMEDEDYHRYAKRVFKDKFKLRGRAAKDLPRQYGKVNKIENLERMKAYTVKSGNIRSNMPQEELDGYMEASFEREDKLKIKDELFQKLRGINLLDWTTNRYGIRDDVNMEHSSMNYSSIVKSILVFFMEQDK